MGRTIVAAATNILARGFLVVPVDRAGRDGGPVNALYAVARALRRAVAFRVPDRAVAVVDVREHADWPPALQTQRAPLLELLRTLGFHVALTEEDADLVASYAQAALDGGDDVVVAGVDKRFAQLVRDRCWWYDTNKDVRYTREIVGKRFDVPPEAIADWLALVGDDSGSDVLPGVKGIGARGATGLLQAHGSVATALARPEAVDKRVARALAAAGDDVARQLARGHLRRDLATALDATTAAYRAPATEALNELYERLGFVEMLVAEKRTIDVTVCDAAGTFAAALAPLGDAVAIQVLLEDAAPVRQAVAGVAVADGHGHGLWVAAGSAVWPEMAAWLADASAPKLGHDTVTATVELHRAGIELQGVAGDSASASHLTEPSNWAPHDLPVVAKHVLGRALPEEDSARGIGKQRKAWRTLGRRAAEHGAELADAAAGIWSKLAPALSPQHLADDAAMRDVCVRMELTGLLVDAAELDRAEAAFAVIEEELQQQIDALAGHAFNVNSSKQLGAVLFEELKLPVVSHTRTGWSTANEALERVEHAHPIVPLVLRWRALRRLRDSWLHSLRRCIDTDGRVHSRFQPSRSFSGQIVNSNPDLGRVPGRTPEMARVRRAFVAAPGRLLMSVDFNQLGLHVLAHLTQDPALVGPLSRRADMHVLTAAAVLDLAPEAVTVEQRQLGKVVNFATFAGQGASALALALGITAAEAKAYIARFDAHYAKVRAFQDEQLRLAREEGGIVTLAGRRWPIGGLSSLDNQVRSYAERLARRATHEASVQDVARRSLLEADRALRREGLGTVPVLQVLDEVLFDVPEEELQTAARVCSAAMRGAYDLEVPLVVGVEAGKNWADLEPVLAPSATVG